MEIKNLCFIWMVIECSIRVMCYCNENFACTKAFNSVNFPVALCMRDEFSEWCNSKPLEQYYNVTGACSPPSCDTVVTDYCNNNPCENGGMCNPLFGSYSCSCKDNYHGRKCDEQGLGKFVKEVYIVFEPITDTIFISCLVFVKETGEYLNIKFSAGGTGEVIFVSKNQMAFDNNARQLCKSIGPMSPYCDYIPAKPMWWVQIFYDVLYNPEDPVITEGFPKKSSPIPGFKVNLISLVIYNKKSEEFNQQFNQIVSYRKNTCPKHVKISQNCGRSSEQPFQLMRKSRIYIEGIVLSVPQTENDCPYSSTEYKWDISVFGTLNSNKAMIKPTKTCREKQVCEIEPFTLKIGMYKVKLIVSTSGRNNRTKKLYDEKYSAICFIEVVKLPLVAKLEGGISRTVSMSKPLVLDASLSHDPNEPTDKQPQIKFGWICKIVDDQNKESKCIDHGISLKASGPIAIAENIKEGQIVKITLGIWKDDQHRSTEMVKALQIINISKFPQIPMEITCYKNCGTDDFKTNPSEVVYLKVKVTDGTDVMDFHWEFSDSKNSKERSAKDISQKGVEPHVLVIREKILTPGLTYTFIVKPSGGQYEGRTSIEISVNKPPSKGECTISPLTGRKAVTEFDIICTNFTVEGDIGQLNYQFYQKSIGGNGLGTMVGYSISGELKKIILTEEYISVRVSDIYGMYVDLNDLKVTFETWEPPIGYVEKMVENISSLALSGDRTNSARTAGAIVDMLQHVPKKGKLINDVLTGLSQNSINSFTEAKLYTSVLKHIVTKGIPLLEKGVIDSSAVKTMGDLMATLSNRVLHEIHQTNREDSDILDDDVKEIASTFLQCTDIIIKSKDETVFDSSAGNLFTFSMHHKFKRATSSMIAALDHIGKAILMGLLPHEQERVVETNNTVMWLKKESPRFLAGLSGIPNNSKTEIKISRSLGEILQERSAAVAMEVTTFKNNPYWWDIQDRDIASEIISVRAWEGSPSEITAVTDVAESIDIYVYVKSITKVTLYGNVTMPNSSDTEDLKDYSIAVHTVEAPDENSNGKLFVEFLSLVENEFLVLITENIRPDYEMMMNDKEVQIVSSKFARISKSFTNIGANTLHFIGILPTSKVPAGKTLSYTFKMHSIQCKVRQLTVWTSPACTVGDETSTDVIHCRCSHLSFFGTSIFVAPNTVHPIQDLYLLMTVKDNPLVFSVILTMLAIYVIFLFWTIIQDRKDGIKRKVIVLEDNFPGEKCPYLVIVYTAFNIGSATDANVAIQLIGRQRKSRAHILHSKERKVLRRNADDWFILFTPSHLGPLESIYLWHDNSGHHPDWCCRKVQVYDMTTKEEFTFMVESWLSVWPGDYIEAVVRCAEPDDLYEWKKVVGHNILYSLQENHLWASIFMCHPRALISKSQRLTMTFCIIMVTLLTGIMFYGVARGQAIEDEAKYELKLREVVIAVQCTVMATVVNSTVITCFKKSNKISPIKTDNKEHLSVNRTDHGIAQSTLRKRVEDEKEKKWYSKWFFKSIHTLVKGKPLMPVLIGVESADSVIRRRQWAVAGWILSQIVIWGSGFFIILYGLKLGKVISKLWLTSATLCFLHGMFVSAPIKIIFFSATLAMFGEMYNIETYECNINTAMRQEHFGDQDFLADLILLRSRPMYSPLHQSKVIELQEVFNFRNKILQAIEFAMTLILFLTLLNIAGDLYNLRNFYINSHITASLTSSWRTISVGLTEVINRSLLTDYLLSTYIPRLFKGKWYNRQSLTSAEESLPQTGWFFDATHRLIGVAQLRQIRVAPEDCLFQKLFNVTGAICVPSLNRNTEDKKNYGQQWKLVRKDMNKPLLAPWTYQAAPVDSSTMFGESGTPYHGGGYTAVLGVTQHECSIIIADLSDLVWWDSHLRGFIAEVTVYNANTDTHTSATIVTEQLPTGWFTHRIHTLTVHLSFHAVSLLLFAVVLLPFNVRLFNTINRDGVVQIFSSFWNSYDLLLVASSDVSLAFECLKVLKSILAVHVFQQSGNNKFFYFSSIVYYQRLSLFLWGFVLCLAPIRVVKYKPFILTCRAPCYTLHRCGTVLITVGLTIFLIGVFQMYIVNFRICPTCKSLDIDTKYYRTGTSSLYFSSYDINATITSLLFSLTCCLSVVILQVILINTYKIMSDY